MAFHRQTSFEIYPAVPKANVYVVKCFVSLMISANEEWIQFHLFSCDLMAAFWNKYPFPPATLIPSINVTLICLFFQYNLAARKQKLFCLFWRSFAFTTVCSEANEFLLFVVASYWFLKQNFLIWEFLVVVFFSFLSHKKKKNLKWNSIEKSPVSFTEQYFFEDIVILK